MEEEEEEEEELTCEEEELIKEGYCRLSCPWGLQQAGRRHAVFWARAVRVWVGDVEPI